MPPTTSPQSTITLLLGIWGHLLRHRRIQLGVLLMFILASGVAELLSLGAVLPFLALLSDPDRVLHQPLVRELSARLGFTETSELLLPVTLAFVAVTVLAAMIRLANLWLGGRLAAAIGSDLSCEAYRRTLYQPYGVHVNRNSATLITGLTTQIPRTVLAFTSLLQLITAAVVAIGLLTGLMLIDWPVATGAAALFGSVYAQLAITVRSELHSNSQLIAAAGKQQIKALQEGLGAIRDVLLDGNQAFYVEIYQQADLPQRQRLATNQFIGAFPRYAVEALGMVSIALMGALMVQQQGTGSAVIPLLGAFALGAQRLLPALQQVYLGWSVLKSSNSHMSAVLAMLNQPMPPVLQTLNVGEHLELRKGIRFEAVHFRYGPEQPEVLQGLDFEICQGERIGFVGSTGSGKSTTVDLLMGLLRPTRGRVLLDGVDLHDPAYPERLAAWTAAIAHVPQSIYLSDCSIAENIAFGVPPHKIDMVRVKQAAAQAQIASFIESSQEGFESFVGERGIRLSGGQRQRIGIARALYKQARVLVLDEATSALDNDTEESVMASVDGLSKELTVVMIAHRLSTVKRCDRVIRLERGTITSDGPLQIIY